MCKQSFTAICAAATLGLMTGPALADDTSTRLDWGASYTQDYWQNTAGGQ